MSARNANAGGREHSFAARGTGTFVSVSGDSTRNVVLNGNDLRYAKQVTSVAKEAAQEVRVQ